MHFLRLNQCPARARVELHAPLLDLTTARAALPGLDENDIQSLIDKRQLPWAWNIALHNGLAARRLRRRAVRVLAKCVRHYQWTRGLRPFPPLTFDQALALILPRNEPLVHGAELKAAWLCSLDHIHNLIASNQLTVEPGTSWQRGRGGAPMITRESIVRFLQKRRL